jgi:hypothetical protein
MTAPASSAGGAGRRAQARRLLGEAATALDSGQDVDIEAVLAQLRAIDAETSQLVRLAFIATREAVENRFQAEERWPRRARVWLKAHQIGFQRRELIRIRDEQLAQAFDGNKSAAVNTRT